jgi:hypothetical protein
MGATLAIICVVNFVCYYAGDIYNKILWYVLFCGKAPVVYSSFL